MVQKTMSKRAFLLFEVVVVLVLLGIALPVVGRLLHLSSKKVLQCKKKIALLQERHEARERGLLS